MLLYGDVDFANTMAMNLIFQCTGGEIINKPVLLPKEKLKLFRLKKLDQIAGEQNESLQTFIEWAGYKV